MEKLEKRNFGKSVTVGTELIENSLKMIKNNSTGDHHKKGKKIFHKNVIELFDWSIEICQMELNLHWSIERTVNSGCAWLDNVVLHKRLPVRIILSIKTKCCDRIQ